MRRKMLISLALVVIMLFNCMAPLMQVEAAATSVFKTITLNNELYYAVKSALTAKNVEFEYSDESLTIEIRESVLTTITEMNLNETRLSDIAGIENFSALTRLDLSGNNLSEKSNLGVLSGLNLEYLDLSTNNIGDVSDIEELISRVKGNGGEVLLTSQYVTNTYIFENNGDETVNVKLPLILEKAGYIKADWMEIYEYGPEITSIPHTVNSINQDVEVNILNNGYLKFKIEIEDTPTEAAAAANKNPAAKNMLKDGVFITYVVVHDKDSTGIHVPDQNLYTEIKKQLSAGQTVNSELASFPYKVDIDNAIIFEECTYEDNGTELLLTVVGDTTAKYYIDKETKLLYKVGTYYPLNTIYEAITIELVDETTGTITYKNGYRVALPGENRNLYQNAYDEPQVFVITNKDLMNKITSLLLNNRQIRDLTGIEYFVGLKSDLNVSHNYLDNIEPIYKLQENKAIYEAELQADYNGVLKNNKNNLNDAVNKTTTEKGKVDSNIETISAKVKDILTQFEAAAKIEKFKKVTEKVTDPDTGEETVTEKEVLNENYEKDLKAIAETIKKIIDEINGYDQTNDVTGETTHVDGYEELLDKALEGMSINLDYVYSQLAQAYDVYNNEYKLLTFLTDGLNYLDLEEYTAYQAKMKNRTEKQNLGKTQISYVGNLVSKKQLTVLEKLYVSALTNGAVDFDKPETYNEYFAEIENPEDYIEAFKRIAIYSEMANYCLIKRMEENTASEYCYEEDYLLNRIKEFEIEGIDTSVEKEILEFIRTNTEDEYHRIYNIYRNGSVDYSNGTETISIPACDSAYDRITDFSYELSHYMNVTEISNKIELDVATYKTKDENIQFVFDQIGAGSIIKTINIFEEIREEYKGEANKLFKYDEVMVLANRLLGGNVTRYVTLPDLKKLDISYNAYLQGIDRIGELSYLRELQANANYLTEIDKIDWNALIYLRKLGLAYNYITDITPLEVLSHIEELDVSHNLLSGVFEFNFTKAQKTLKFFNLSHNQLEDITRILEFLDRKSGGNFANYMATEGNVYIDLGYQDIVIDVEKPILLNSNPETTNVDLPMIFVQLLAIDAARTSLGNTSLDGRIESEGRYVTVNTNTEGPKTGVVEILKMPNAETCVGEGTKATINYFVGLRTFDTFEINENIERMERGTTQTFTVKVEGQYIEEKDKRVTWSVEGAAHEGTTINENGVLTVSAEETAETIKVIATSKYDETKKSEKDITLFSKSVTSVTVKEQDVKIEKGKSATFTAEVVGENLEDADKEYTWSVEGTTNANTTIDENGVLTVAADEAAATLTVVATSKYDNTKSGTSTVTTFVKTVTSVTVTENTRTKPGTQVTFTAEVVGENLEDADKGVTWSIYGNKTPYTMINPVTGELTIAADEDADTIMVVATSKYNPAIVGTAEVKLIIVRGVTVESEGNQIYNEGRMNFTAKVEGPNLTEEEKAVTWDVIGATDAKTMITDAGVLTIGADETAETITVQATSVTDTTKVGTKEMEIVIPVPTLGYSVDENDETLIVGVSPKTTSEDFKEKLVTDNDYTVVIKRDGEEISDTTNVATGDMAVISFDGKLVETFEIVVKGDVNADGTADALDSSLIKAHRAKLTTLTGSFLKAADINSDDEISVVDVRLLLYHRARLDGYIL